MDSSQSEIDDLLRRASTGDDQAISALLQRHRRRLKAMVAARIDTRVRTRVDPSDVIQETFVAAAQQLPQYLESRPIPFYPWLRRIAWQTLVHVHERHLDAGCRSVRREQQGGWQTSEASAVELARLLEKDQTSPSGVLARKEQRLSIQSALERLPVLDREVLLQRYVEQMSIAEIAAAEGLTEAAVYKRHARALERLGALMEGKSP